MKAPVLLLNASYEAICVVSARRAVNLLLSGKAESVTDFDNAEVRSSTMSMPMPSVIRLVRYINIPRFRKAYLSRRAILQRDNHKCAYCGGRATTMDHIMPRSRGGEHTWTNIVACCYSCNQTKDNRTPEELGWRLLFDAYRPEGDRRLVIIAGNVHPSWEKWLDLAA